MYTYRHDFLPSKHFVPLRLTHHQACCYDSHSVGFALSYASSSPRIQKWSEYKYLVVVVVVVMVCCRRTRYVMHMLHLVPHLFANLDIIYGTFRALTSSFLPNS